MYQFITIIIWTSFCLYTRNPIKTICIKAITKMNSVVISSLTVKMRFNTKFPGLGGTFCVKRLTSIIFRNSKTV